MLRRHVVLTAVECSRDVAASRCLNCCRDQQKRYGVTLLELLLRAAETCGVTLFELLLRAAETLRCHVI